MESLGETVKLRMKGLEGVKRQYEDRDYDIARFVNPRRELVKDSQRFDDKGQRRGKDSYNGTPNSALGVWADGMQGVMVSQSLRWFKSVMDNYRLNEIKEVRAYLQDYDEAMYGEFNRSNFYATIGEWFRDAGSVGTATNYTEEDIENDSSVHYIVHPREIFIAENRYGEVDTIFRKFFLTARQAVQKFDAKKLSKDCVDNAEKHPEKLYEFIHATFPNRDRMFNKFNGGNKPIRSVYVQVVNNPETDGVVKVGGYDVNPYAVWRFRKNSDEVYGYSPAADALVEIYALNQVSKTMLKARHMAVSPMWNIPEHMRGHVRIEPDGLNYYRDNQIIQPAVSGMNIPAGTEQEEQLQRLIEDKYRVEFFLTLARAEREMTATEIMERQSEKAVLMGPQVDRLITEGLSKVFNVVAYIAERGGRLPPPPPVLQDYEGKIEIVFNGPLAQAQRRLFQMQPIKNGLNELAQASVLFPDIKDRIDEKKLSTQILKSSDFPEDLMRDDTEFDELRQQRAQQLAAQQQMEMAGKMAEAYPKLNEKVEEGSPAEMLGE